MKRLLAFFAIATFGITTLSAENVETVYSPDGKVKLFVRRRSSPVFGGLRRIACRADKRYGVRIGRQVR